MEKKPVSYFLVGTVLGLLSIILFLVYYFTGIAFQENSLSWIPTLATVGLIIYFVTQYGRDTQYNSSFGTLFSYGFRSTIIWVLIMVAFMLLALYIFPEYKDKVLEQTRANLDKQGKLSDDQKDEFIKRFDSYFKVFIVGGSLFMNMIIGAIASLIGAFATKKNPVTPFN